MISLVLCTKGRSGELHRYLKSLGMQDCSAWRLIVVDQNEDADIVRHALVSTRVQADIIRQAPGLSRARNTGWRACEGEWVMFPDDDCYYLDSGVLRGVVRELSRCPATTAACVFPLCDGVTNREADFEYRDDFRPKVRVLNGNGLRTGGVAAAASAFRLSGLKMIGGFDERFGLGGIFAADEDMDAMIRLSKDGFMVCSIGRPAIMHPLRQDHREAQWARYTLARGALYRKHAWSRQTRGWAIRDMVRMVRQGILGKEPLTHAVQLPILLATGFLSYRYDPGSQGESLGANCV